MHTTAFSITNVMLTEDQDPTDEMLREAAKQAITFAKAAQNGDQNGTDYESFALGNRRHRFIQGNALNNRETFAGLDDREWPNLQHPVMSQIREPDLSPEAIAAIPIEILRKSWNSGRDLVRLALRNQPVPGKNMDDTLIFPDLLVSEAGVLGECITFPDEDVFGDSAFDLARGNSMTMSQYIAGDPGSAFHATQSPLRRLAKAQFHCEYIRLMDRHNDRLVLEADWNM